MKSKFFLNFKDPQSSWEYMYKRNPEILIISLLLLIARLIILVVIFVNHFYPESHILYERVWLNSIGVVIHILFLIPLLLEKVKFWQAIHGPVVILSYSTYVFNKNEDLNGDQSVTFLGYQMVLIVSVSTLN